MKRSYGTRCQPSAVRCIVTWVVDASSGLGDNNGPYALVQKPRTSRQQSTMSRSKHAAEVAKEFEMPRRLYETTDSPSRHGITSRFAIVKPDGSIVFGRPLRRGPVPWVCLGHARRLTRNGGSVCPRSRTLSEPLRRSGSGMSGLNGTL